MFDDMIFDFRLKTQQVVQMRVLVSLFFFSLHSKYDLIMFVLLFEHAQNSTMISEPYLFSVTILCVLIVIV